MVPFIVTSLSAYHNQWQELGRAVYGRHSSNMGVYTGLQILLKVFFEHLLRLPQPLFIFLKAGGKLIYVVSDSSIISV